MMTMTMSTQMRRGGKGVGAAMLALRGADRCCQLTFRSTCIRVSFLSAMDPAGSRVRR